jgi:hypothetical protein
MLRAAPIGRFATELGASRKDGVNHGLLLLGHEFYSDPIPDLGKFGIGSAGFVEAMAGDLREEFRLRGPNAEEMFILHRHARGNQAFGMVGRELLIEVSVPAQLRQVHRHVVIESFMKINSLAGILK